MEMLSKLVALSALVIGVLALERTWYVNYLQRRFQDISTQITQRNLNIVETTTTVAARLHEVILRRRKSSGRPGNIKDTRGDFDWFVYRNNNSQYLGCHLELDTFGNAHWKTKKSKATTWKAEIEGR